ncbi:hypothetical protein KJ972_01410 [Candidatus Micrarchaeota archaeon]|nr:hypothetical protein [Candidatus Micrarchaeota archaeon]
MNRTLFILSIALLLAGMAHAATITQHSVEIEVDTAGFGNVTEKFVFLFESEQELENFRVQARKIGADLDAWRAFDGNITNYIGEIKAGSIGYEETEGDRQVKLEYTTQEPLFLVNETARQIEYHLDSRSFELFRQGSIYIIPGNTKIIFFLPPSATIDIESLKPGLANLEAINQAKSEKRIFWVGHLSVSGDLEMNFTTEKQIVPSFSVSQLLQDLIESGEASFLAAIALILLGMVYFKRKSIQRKIENYLVENSSLEHKKETEEIEIEE